MKDIVVPANWRRGRYTIVASSAQSLREWEAFVEKAPTAMQSAFERLSEHPLGALGARQFPLKGKHLKPLWQYEVTGGDRLFYAVDLEEQVIVVCVMPHAADAQAAAATVEPRKRVVDDTIAAQEKALVQKTKPAPGAKKPKRKR